jgi:histidinol-phosphatase (PHP family)
LRVKKDGHIHSPFCPHGSKDKMVDYVEKAIQLGFDEISFTEHAPLPNGFVDTTPTKDSAMSLVDLERYLVEVEKLKIEYKEKLKVNVGLEIDYIEGFEEETKSFLNDYGPKLDDAILSVHFLKNGPRYDCVDYSPDLFNKMISDYGSIDQIYQRYFETVMFSIMANLGMYKPKRMGHITLINKFQKKFPSKQSFEKEILELLRMVKEKGYELDYNGAGTAKPLCRETYPPDWVIEEAKKLRIPLVYGSDAHRVKELNQGRESILLP